MATASGFDSQIGYAVEATPGTYVAPTKTIEHVSESIKFNQERIESMGIKAGRRGGSGRWALGRSWVEGSVQHELSASTIGPLFRNLMGAVSTSGVGPFTHVFTYGALSEGALTIQVGRPDLSGTVNVFSYLGCQITDLKLSSKVGEISHLDFSVYGQKEDTAQSLAAASYPSTWSPFTFAHGVLSLAGAEYEFDDIELDFNSGLQTARHTHRSSTPTQPRISKESAFRTAGGTVNSEFISMTAYNRFKNGTEAALSMVWNAGASLQLTIAGNVRFDGETPNVTGPEMLKQSLPFKFLSTTSDAAMLTATLVNSDTVTTAF
jgi:hypothetical protein